MASKLGLGPLGPSLDALRRGGASEDLLGGSRGALDVKLRGRRRSDPSLRRYGKQTRLLRQLGFVPGATLSYGELVSRDLEAIFMCQCSILVPPLALGLPINSVRMPCNPVRPPSCSSAALSIVFGRLQWNGRHLKGPQSSWMRPPSLGHQAWSSV